MPYTIAIDARKQRDFGIGTYIRNLVGHLAAVDHDNRYLLFVAPDGRDRFAHLPANFRTVVQRAPVYSVRELVSLSWSLFRQKVDLYHSTHYVLPLGIPCRVVTTIHDIIHVLYPEFLPNRLARSYADTMIRRALSRSDAIITVSDNTKADLARHFRVADDKVQVIHNGIEESFLATMAEADLRRWLHDFELDEPYVLFVGNPKPHKNLDNVIKAYARALEKADFPHPLVCVGDRGGVGFKIRQRARQLGIESRVRLIGHVAEEALPALYQGATIFLYPTLYEGFGLPVVEAMASGVPVITSNTSALKEIGAGYADLVNPLDVDGMADAIVRCLTDEDHRASLRKLGLRRSHDFRWDRAAHQTLAVYGGVLGAEDGGDG